MFKLLSIFNGVHVLDKKGKLRTLRNSLVVIYFVVYLTILWESVTVTSKSREMSLMRIWKEPVVWPDRGTSPNFALWGSVIHPKT
jgi:hypothetical protein